jgi:hypothetical protein
VIHWKRNVHCFAVSLRQSESTDCPGIIVAGITTRRHWLAINVRELRHTVLVIFESRLILSPIESVSFPQTRVVESWSIDQYSITCRSFRLVRFEFRSRVSRSEQRAFLETGLFALFIPLSIEMAAYGKSMELESRLDLQETDSLSNLPVQNSRLGYSP